MSQRSRITRYACLALLAAAPVASGQEKTETQNRRSITTSEWPSLRGVLAIEEVRNLLELNEEEQDEIRLFVEDKRPRRGGDEPVDTVSPPPPPDAAVWQR